MRHARIKAEEPGLCHGMSRIVEQRMILGDVEKGRFLKLIFDLAALCGGA